MTINTAHFILYVADQQRSTEFYAKALAIEPRLNVPGMTEFEISETAILGLMPLTSVRKLFDLVSNNAGTEGELKAELYLMVDEPKLYHQRALANGAEELSPIMERDWSHTAAYSVDPYGNVIAFARLITEQA